MIAGYIESPQTAGSTTFDKKHEYFLGIDPEVHSKIEYRQKWFIVIPQPRLPHDHVYCVANPESGAPHVFTL